MRWNYYKLRQLSLLQSAMDRYYKLRQLFYYKVRHGLLQGATAITCRMDLLQIVTGITKCDDYYKLRQSLRKLLFDILNSEDAYIHTPTLIKHRHV